MQRRNLLFLLLGCAIVGVIFALAREGEVAPPPGSTDPEARGPSVPAGGDGPGIDGPGIGALPPHAPHVELTLTSREAFAPPPAEPSRAVTERGDELPTRLLAGIGSGFDADPQRRGVAMAWLTFPGGDLLRQVVVEPDRVLPITIGGIVTMRGRVVDEQQRAVAGAAVSFGELEPDGGLREVRTDDEGRYECDVRASDGVPFVVRAPGYAATWRPLTVSVVSQAADATLSPACTLQVQLATSAADVTPRAFVACPEQLSTGLAQWPFFLQALGDGYAVDPRGRCEIDDLPAEGAARVVVRHPLAPAATAIAKLQPGHAQLVVPVPLAARRRVGMVVDESGAALASVMVFSHFERDPIGGARSQRLLPPHVDARGVCVATTDAAGTFVVGVQEGRGQVLTLRRFGHAGREVAWDHAMEAELVLPAWRRGEARLRVLPPRPGEAWTVATNLGDGLRDDVAADEPWQVSLPHAGIYDVDVTVAIDGEVRARRSWQQRVVTDVVDVETPLVD